MKAWVFSVIVWLDQGINTVLGPLANMLLDPLYLFGSPDETLSSVLGKNVKAGTCRACRTVCRILHYFDPGHCESAIEPDEGRSIAEPSNTNFDRS